MSIGYEDGSVVVSNVFVMTLQGTAMVYVDETDPATNRVKPEKRLESVARLLELYKITDLSVKRSITGWFKRNGSC